jgi:hypothetical protein
LYQLRGISSSESVNVSQFFCGSESAAGLTSKNNRTSLAELERWDVAGRDLNCSWWMVVFVRRVKASDECRYERASRESCAWPWVLLKMKTKRFHRVLRGLGACDKSRFRAGARLPLHFARNWPGGDAVKERWHCADQEMRRQTVPAFHLATILQ